MKSIAVIVETRNIDIDEIIHRHIKYLPRWDVHHVKDVIINNRQDYNRLLLSTYFWMHYLKYERVLIFQHDSSILRYGINEFMEWDYIGAPWPIEKEMLHPKRYGGNGGFSLRNPRKILELLALTKDEVKPHEDIFYSNTLEKVGGKVAPFEVSSKFACEQIFRLGTFGYHNISRYFSIEQVNKINTYESNHQNDHLER